MFKPFFCLFATFIICLSACSDNNDVFIPEDADENFITSVVLTADGATYTAQIENNTITLTVPYTVTLDKAEAKFTYTASATMVPDPETITDWDNERIFRVTSYNGDANEYTYKVVKDEIRHEGDALLQTAADVAAFVASDITIVKGNLIIGSDEANAGPLTDISALSLLKEVEGNIIIRNSYQGADLTGLDNITSAGGLFIGNEKEYSTAPALEIVAMRSLQRVSGDILIRNHYTSYVRFVNLISVEGDLTYCSSSLAGLDFPELTHIGNNLVIEGINDEEEAGGSIAGVTFPELATVAGKVSVNDLAYLTSIRFPKLHTAGSIGWETIPVILGTIELPELTVVNGDLFIEANQIKGDTSTSTVNHTLLRIDGLSKLTTVRGMLTVSNFQAMTELPDISSLTTLGGITLNRLDACNGQELDLTHVNFEIFDDVHPSIHIIGNTNLSKIITREDISHVDFTLQTNGNTATNLAIFPEMNFKSVRNFTNTYNATADPVYLFERVYGNLTLQRSGAMRGMTAPYLTQVDGYMYVSGAMARNVSFSELESVGGQLYVTGFSNSMPDFPKLKYVCCTEPAVYERTGEATNGTPVGALDIQATNQNMIFPELQRVGGVGFTAHGVRSLSCPQLTTIDGTLCIEAASQITAVDMPLLEKLTGLFFSGLTRFVDFTDFGRFVKDGNITEPNWTVRTCGYNPTYQDMVDEKYTAR